MNKKVIEKEEKKIEIKELDQVTEVEADGVVTDEAKAGIMKKEIIAKEEIEEDIDQEEEEATEEGDEVNVGRTLLPLPRRCLPRLGQEAKTK